MSTDLSTYTHHNQLKYNQMELHSRHFRTGIRYGVKYTNKDASQKSSTNRPNRPINTEK